MQIYQYKFYCQHCCCKFCFHCLGHTDAVTIVDAVLLEGNSCKYPALLVVTASVDSTMRIWLRTSGSSKSSFYF